MDRATALYLRVSTCDQECASQVPDLQLYASCNPGEYLTFSDQFTGRSMQRPQFDRLMEAVRAGRVGKLVVWRLDRLGRSAHGLLSLARELEALQVQLVSLKEGLDLATPAGRLVFAILASVAEFETEVRAERVKAGIAAARRSGKRWGGSKKGWISAAVQERAGDVVQLFIAGVNVTNIARLTGLSRGTVRKIIAFAEEAERE